MPHWMAKDTAVAVKKLPRWMNRSLLYAKYSNLPLDRRDHDARRDSLEHLERAGEEPGGAEIRLGFFAHLDGSPLATSKFQATLKGRLLVDHAGGVIENAGLCLDRHYGMPYIPGTALKGIALRAARALEADPSSVADVFGEQDRAADAVKGKVSYLPAYPVSTARVALDILTCHHTKYYRGKEPAFADAPDTEQPIPVIFPAVEPGIDFAFMVTAVRHTVPKSLVDDASAWLRWGVTNLGVGAKTSAGYGWFEIDEEAEAKRDLEREQAEERTREKREESEREVARRSTLDPADLAREDLLAMSDQGFAKAVRNLIGKPEPEQRACLQLLKKEKRDKWKTWRKNKKSFVDEVLKLAGELGEELS